MVLSGVPVELLQPSSSPREPQQQQQHHRQHQHLALKHLSIDELPSAPSEQRTLIDLVRVALEPRRNATSDQEEEEEAEEAEGDEDGAAESSSNNNNTMPTPVGAVAVRVLRSEVGRSVGRSVCGRARMDGCVRSGTIATVC